MTLPHFNPLVAGEWVEVSDSESIESPFSEQALATIGLAGFPEIEEATAAAARSFEQTRGLPSYARAEILRQVSDAIGGDATEFVSAIMAEGGKPLQFAQGEVERARLTFRLASEEVHRFGGEVLPLDVEPRATDYRGHWIRVPRGPVLAFTPFNFPLNLVAHKMAPAMALGCPIVLKPAPQAPTAALHLAGLILDAGWPPEAISVLPCGLEQAQQLVSDERFTTFSFTGSDRVGWMLREKAGRKRTLLELGGNAAAVVHADADLEQAAQRLAFGSFAHAGQVCIKVQRVFVQEAVYEELVGRFVEASRQLPVGDPGLPETVVGPLIDRRAADRVESWIEEAIQMGARSLLRGDRKGNVLGPTILEAVPSESRVACEEVFGPVTLVEPYGKWEDALERVNETPYGLQAGLFTRDVDRIHQAIDRLDVGGIVVGDVPTFRVDSMPYGGVKRSGLGREGLRFAMEEMSEIRMVIYRQGYR